MAKERREERGEVDIRREADASRTGGRRGNNAWRLFDRGRKDEPSFLSRRCRRSTLPSFLPPFFLALPGRGEGRTNLVLMPALSGEGGGGGCGGGGVVGGGGQPERIVNTAFAEHLKSIL